VILSYNVLLVNRVISEKRLGSEGPQVPSYLQEDPTRSVIAQGA
jgi:hypothetical protein